MTVGGLQLNREAATNDVTCIISCESLVSVQVI